jgi:hypothetical protein
MPSKKASCVLSETFLLASGSIEEQHLNVGLAVTDHVSYHESSLAASTAVPFTSGCAVTDWAYRSQILQRLTIWGRRHLFMDVCWVLVAYDRH